MGFGVWEGLQWVGNGYGLQMYGFSVQTETYGSIFNDFNDCGHFGIVSGDLTLLPEGPGTLSDGPGALSDGPDILFEGSATL